MKSVIFEITEHELHVFKVSLPLFASLKRSHCSSWVKFDRIQIPGILEQGIVRDEAALLQYLIDYRAENSCKGYQAFLAIPLQSGFVRSYKIPWLAKHHRESAIALLVAEEVPSSSGLLYYDYLILEEERHDSLTILLGALRQEILAQYLAVFKQAGIRVGGVNFSWAVLGQGLGFISGEDVLYLQEDLGGLQVALFHGQVPESVRFLSSAKPAVEIDNNEENNPDIYNYSEEQVKEIRRFLLYFNAQPPGLNLRRIVWSGNPALESLAKSILQADNAALVEQAKLTSVPEVWLRILGENNGFAEPAIAYAIRIFQKSMLLNLGRQPEKSLKVQLRYQRLVVILMAFLIIGNSFWLSFHQKTSVLQQENRRLSQKGYKIEAQLRQQQELTRSWGIARSHSGRIGGSLRQIQALLEPRLTIQTLDYRQGNLSLTGRASDIECIQSLIQGLRKLDWNRPVLRGYTSTSPEHIEFSLSASRKSADS
ncbi:Competence protein A [Desulfosporosinus acidiphilus SJ4]|uniref:Competence protein A n=1 Tax=Desulfosporosinus acidiphilus (strain DSM 22704 / JCM 16185 / SJ4) TaxID=646529 RepID=I4D8Y3_DESAJ|nr:Competence protein A [Desulfosporosinus acidiphilus]AFM42257.1 Competence protein A [Desulfosporosinus acidiphilus SJ4]